MIEDAQISQYLRSGVGLKELTAFFKKEIYEVFVRHENTDLIDPKSNTLLSEKLPLVFYCRINEQLINRILAYINTMKYMEIYENVPEVLESLKEKRLSISMISNMMLPGKLLIEKLHENSILHYFDTITVSSDIGFIKPHKEIFLHTLKKDHLVASEVLFVGDTYSQDIIGAKNVGMKTVWLNCRNEIIQQSEAADYEIHKLEDLGKMLQCILDY